MAGFWTGLLSDFWEFARMGGHGGYVWFCFGVAVAMQVGFAVVLWRRWRALGTGTRGGR